MWVCKAKGGALRMKPKPNGVILASLLFWGCAVSGNKPAPLKTVPFVDLARYSGTWYEIARYPAWFEKGCTCVTATYTPLPGGKIGVLNKCRDKSPEGREKKAKGRAKVSDGATNSKLKVTFFWPFYADYWIIDLDPNYEYAVVGEPGRKYLWILSRTPRMDPAVREGITKRLVEQGYDPSRLEETVQQ